MIFLPFFFSYFEFSFESWKKKSLASAPKNRVGRETENKPFFFFFFLRDITICLFYMTFDLHLWRSAFVKVTNAFIIRCILCCWMFVPKMKFVGSVELEIWKFVWWKPKWRHHPCDFYEIFNANLQRAYLSGILNFSLIRHKRAKIYSREVNRELWIKNGYWVTVTLTFDPRSPISIGSEVIQ